MNEWKPVVGHEDKYLVSDDGRVARILRGRKDGNGYVTYALTEKKYETKMILGHALVAEAFHGTRPAGSQINHKDGCKDHNAASNLEYVSRKENMRHAYKLCLVPVGEKHPMAKLSKGDVIEIRRLKGTAPQREIAERFGVSQSSVSSIHRNELWKEEKLS